MCPRELPLSPWAQDLREGVALGLGGAREVVSLLVMLKPSVIRPKLCLFTLMCRFGPRSSRHCYYGSMHSGRAS